MTILLVSHFIVALHSFMYTPTMYQLLLLLLLSLHFASVGASPQFRPSCVGALPLVTSLGTNINCRHPTTTALHWMVMGWEGKGGRRRRLPYYWPRVQVVHRIGHSVQYIDRSIWGTV